MTTITCWRSIAKRGLWGGIAKSNFAGLRFRAPVYRTLRELALSYFEHYYNLRGQRTLRSYSGGEPGTPGQPALDDLGGRRMVRAGAAHRGAALSVISRQGGARTSAAGSPQLRSWNARLDEALKGFARKVAIANSYLNCSIAGKGSFSGLMVASRTDFCSEFEQAFVVLTGSGELHATDVTGNGDDRDAGEAEWGGIAEDPAAGLAIVCAHVEPRYRRGGQQKQFVFL